MVWAIIQWEWDYSCKEKFLPNFTSAPSTFKFRLITIVSTHSQRRTQNNESEKQEINKLFSVLRVNFKVVMSRKKLLQLLLIDSTFALLKQIVIFHLIYNFYLQFHHKIFHLFAQFLEAIYFWH